MLVVSKLPRRLLLVCTWILLAWPTTTEGRLRRRDDASALPLEKRDGEKIEQEIPQSESSRRASTSTAYHIMSPQQIKQELMLWQSKYPGFVRVTTSQQAYGLPTAGQSSDCPYENGAGCLNYFATIQDYVAHPVGSNSSNRLPEVFWSGAVHGDERVGPTAVVQAGTLLLAAASCEAAVSARAIRICQASLAQQGINDAQRRWLARLVLTRRIVVVPTANALGYYQNVRQEGAVDVNRDFPYDVLESSACMQSVAARTVNEIYRDHLFQLSLTFHAGTELIGYEWGAPSWLGLLSPDDKAQNQIAAGYSRYAGTFPSDTVYEYGDQNSIIYWVRGGMEDWAYAGSWTTSKVINCKPSTFGGYAASKTIYNNSTLRAFNIIVETSNDKTPADSILGSSDNILTAVTGATNGHIARNIRLALLSAELVEPYISVVSIDQVPIVDRFPLKTTRKSPTDCLQNKTVVVSSNSSNIRNQVLPVEWTVGGGFVIEYTKLYYAVLNAALLKKLDCWSQPSSQLLSQFSEAVVVGSNVGTTYFSSAGAVPAPTAAGAKAYLGPRFQGHISLSSIQGGASGQTLVVMASAEMDQSWASRPSQSYGPKVAPQGHVVNARTNPSWHHESSGKIIQGRLEWFSPPILISLPK